MAHTPRSRRRTPVLKGDDAPLGGVDGEYRSLTQLIVSRLRKSIYAGEHRPGARLNITDLATRLNVSAIPVREALRNLEAEGLVEFQLNRGVLVRELSAAQLRELFLVRLPLETLAAVEATHWKDEKGLQGLEAILRKMDATKSEENWRTLHEQFHKELYALSELPRLVQMIDGLRGQMRPYAKLFHDEPEQIANAQDEHHALVKALRRRDKEKIVQIMHEHLNRPARLALGNIGAPDRMTSEFFPR